VGAIDDARSDLLAVAGRAARPRWMNRAACRSHLGRWWFTASTRRRAIRICGHCPVRDDCLAYALNGDEQYGVWGGLTAEERRALRHGRSSGGGGPGPPDRPTTRLSECLTNCRRPSEVATGGQQCPVAGSTMRDNVVAPE
jgi:WhiB family redox-sensing transcriptional regulator